MPGMGLDNPAVGYCTFAGVKLVGYTVAAAGLARIYRAASRREPPAVPRLYPRSAAGVLGVGAARTAIGLAVGALYVGLWFLYGSVVAKHGGGGPTMPVLYLLGLLPVRLCEWWAVLWIFFDRDLRGRKGWLCAAGGTLASYALDVPAMFGLLATGGFSVC